MSILDSVLRYKEQRDAQKNADISAIPQAMMQFQAGRQQATDNLLKSLTLQATLATKGLSLTQNPQGGYSLGRDNSLLSPTDLLKSEQMQSQINLNKAKTTTAQNQQSFLDNYLNGGTPDPSQKGFGTMFSGVSSSGKPTFKNDTPLDMANRASGLRKELISNPLVKDYQEISSRVSSLDSLLKQADSGDNKSLGTLDQALVTTFNKITDPNSVVRESEYARTPEGGSLIARFEGNIQKLQKGGAGLTPDLRRQLVADAKKIANGVGQNYNQILSGYEDMAGRYKVDSKDVFGPLKKHSDYSNMVTISNGKETRTVTEEEAKKLGAL